jgi:hypothetical protein
MNNTIKYGIIAIIILALFLVVFYLKGEGSSLTNFSLVKDESFLTSSVGNQELALLNQVKSIKIDLKFFEDPIFNSLSDITKDVQSVPVGRDNPFSPVPGIPSPLQSTQLERK